MTLEALNKRIKTTTDLREIVSTMKVLSSVSIGPYEKAFASLTEYSKTVRDAFWGFMLESDFILPNNKKSKENHYLAVLIGTDNGLVGKFNRDILAFAQNYFKDQQINLDNVYYLCVGKRLGAMTQTAVGTKLHGTYAISNSLKEIGSIASTVLVKINEIISKTDTTKVFVFHNQKESGSTQKPKASQLIPLPYDELIQLKKNKWDGKSLPILPENTQGMLLGLMHEYLTVVLTGGLTASLAAEHYTRMINMQQAEKNIDKSLEDMNLAYQQARQTQITDELIDIVSGAEAMKPKKKQDNFMTNEVCA